MPLVLTPRQEVLLAFLGSGSGTVDPIRVMKGLFLIAQRMPEELLPLGARYEFVPYSYGPCSFEIYRDLELLTGSGLINAEDVLGTSWKVYSSTRRGDVAVVEILAGFPQEMGVYIRRIREFVTSVSFRDLLHAVYEAYPDFAARSVFR